MENHASAIVTDGSRGIAETPDVYFVPMRSAGFSPPACSLLL